MTDDVIDIEENPGEPQDESESAEGGEDSASGDAAESDSLVPGRPLSPKHRRLCEWIAQGELKNYEIAEKMGYTESWVSTLKRNPKIAAEVTRVSQKIYEDTVKARLKSMATPAMDHINYVLTDRTNRVKISEKNDVAKWLIEKIDGKAAQVHDVGENLLGVMLDRLDAMKSSEKTDLSAVARDITPQAQLTSTSDEPKTEEELLAEWLTQNPLA